TFIASGWRSRLTVKDSTETRASSAVHVSQSSSFAKFSYSRSFACFAGQTSVAVVPRWAKCGRAPFSTVPVKFVFRLSCEKRQDRAREPGLARESEKELRKRKAKLALTFSAVAQLRCLFRA